MSGNVDISMCFDVWSYNTFIVKKKAFTFETLSVYNTLFVVTAGFWQYITKEEACVIYGTEVAESEERGWTWGEGQTTKGSWDTT